MHTVRLIVAGLFIMLTGSTSRAAPCDGFTDVDSANSTYCPAVTYLKDKGITLGCTGTTYCPNDFVTRLQMALFLQRVGRGGPTNALGDHTDTIAGGDGNTTNESYSTVGGGNFNSALGIVATVTGGFNNLASGGAATIGGGQANIASADFSTIVGGLGNIAAGPNSTVLGGVENSALGAGSLVAGSGAQTTAAGINSFVFADGSPSTITSSAANEFIVAASGGIRLLTSKTGTTGCSIAAGGGTWACTSAKDAKRDFSDVDRDEVLAKVAELPIQRWRYENENSQVRHMGTFAQEFHAAFGLGSDDRTISMVDADGVALAAIQSLNAKLEAQARDLADLRTRLARFAERQDVASGAR